MGPVEAAARSPVPGAALGDLPSSRAARAGGRAGRTAYKHPSSLAGSSLRSQCSFRRVFSGTAHEITPALRLARPKRVRARLDPFAYFKHGEWRLLPTLARPTTRTILRVRKTKPADVSCSRCSTSRRSGGACTFHDRWRHALQRDEREHHRVRPWPNSCSVLTVLPYLTLATTLGLVLLQREGGRTGSPACSRSSRCARTTRSIDR